MPPSEPSQQSGQLTANSSLQTQQTLPPVGPSPLPQQLQQYTMNPSGSSPLPSMAQPQFPPGVKPPQNEQASASALPPLHHQSQVVGGQRPPSTSQHQPPQRPTVPAAFPGSLSDLVVSFENVKQKGLLSIILSLL